MATPSPVTVRVKLDTSDILKNIEFLKDLPEVDYANGFYVADNTTSHNPVTYTDIDTRIKHLVAIKLRMEADAKYPSVEEDKAAAEKKANDDLRTSEIALKALNLYNEFCDTNYQSWDVVSAGLGVDDVTVQDWIAQAEAHEKEAAEKLAWRRNELTSNLVGIDVTYASRSKVIQRAVDKIIELEDKLA